MAIKVTVVSDNKNRISINNQNRTSIRTVAVIPSLSTSISTLTDVDATDPNENETLVYDEASGKYIVKTLPNISGGTF